MKKTRIGEGDWWVYADPPYLKPRRRNRMPPRPKTRCEACGLEVASSAFNKHKNSFRCQVRVQTQKLRARGLVHYRYGPALRRAEILGIEPARLERQRGFFTYYIPEWIVIISKSLIKSMIPLEIRPPIFEAVGESETAQQLVKILSSLVLTKAREPGTVPAAFLITVAKTSEIVDYYGDPGQRRPNIYKLSRWIETVHVLLIDEGYNDLKLSKDCTDYLRWSAEKAVEISDALKERRNKFPIALNLIPKLLEEIRNAPYR